MARNDRHGECSIFIYFYNIYQPPGGVRSPCSAQQAACKTLARFGGVTLELCCKPALAASRPSLLNPPQDRTYSMVRRCVNQSQAVAPRAPHKQWLKAPSMLRPLRAPPTPRRSPARATANRPVSDGVLPHKFGALNASGVRVGTERWWETSEGRLESPNPFVSEKDARRTARTWEENHRYVRPQVPASPAGVRPPRRRVRVPRGGLLSTYGRIP